MNTRVDGQDFDFRVPVNMNATAGLEWIGWVEGGEVFPRGIQERNRRFTEYRQLYNGATGTFTTIHEVIQAFDTQLPVHMNWFRQTARRYADFTMGRPRDEQMLAPDVWRLCYNLLVYHQAYGTAVAVVDELNRVIAVPPWNYWRWNSMQQWLVDLTGEGKYWSGYTFYPFSQDLVRQGFSVTDQGKIEGEPSWELFRLHTSFDGDAAVVMPALPALTDVGESIFDDMYLLVQELTRRNTLDSFVLNKHSNPWLATKIPPTINPDAGPYQPPRDNQIEENTGFRVGASPLRTYFSREHLTSVLEIHAEAYESVDFMTYQALLNESNQTHTRIEQLLAAVTGLPLSFLTADIKTPSGLVALRQIHISAYARTLQMQDQVIFTLLRLNEVREAMGFGSQPEVVPWLNAWDAEAELAVEIAGHAADTA